MPLSLTFVAGTLELRGLPADAPAPAGCRWDPRAACHRAPAIAYADIVRAFHNKGVELACQLQVSTQCTRHHLDLQGRASRTSIIKFTLIAAEQVMSVQQIERTAENIEYEEMIHAE